MPLGKPRAHWRRDENGDWIAFIAGMNAKVDKPRPPLGFCHWSVWTGEQHGGSGGTSSVKESKWAAANEAWRFATFLKSKALNANKQP